MWTKLKGPSSRELSRYRRSAQVVFFFLDLALLHSATRGNTPLSVGKKCPQSDNRWTRGRHLNSRPVALTRFLTYVEASNRAVPLATHFHVVLGSIKTAATRDPPALTCRKFISLG